MYYGLTSPGLVCFTDTVFHHHLSLSLSLSHAPASFKVSGRAHGEDPLREQAAASGAEAAHRNHQRPAAPEETTLPTVQHSIKRAPAEPRLAETECVWYY